MSDECKYDNFEILGPQGEVMPDECKHDDAEWYKVEDCRKCPMKYKTGDMIRCNLGLADLPSTGIHPNCPVIRPCAKLMARKEK